MPGVVDPLSGPLGSHWTVILAAIKANHRQVAALVAGSTQGTLVDQWGNAVEVYGTNLLATVTIGAAFQQAGVIVTTGFAASPPVAGRAKQANLLITTITLTKNSAAATVGSAGLANGQVIGAAVVSDPSTGVATSAITPGTTVQSGGGTTSITLSAVAAESGTALYCAACNFSKL